MEQKTVLVCCASSMVTSTVAVSKIREIAVAAGTPEPRFIQCRFSEVTGNLATNQVDFIVSTGKLKDIHVGAVPVVEAVAFVTGIGEGVIQKQISEKLRA